MNIPLYLVTVKLPKNPDHNPHDKKTGVCPASQQVCTDATGEHHTVVVSSTWGLEAVTEACKTQFGHVTRVEVANHFFDLKSNTSRSR